MARFVSPSTARLAAFALLWTGVMAESLDSALIGVIVAGVCVAVLIIVIVVFVAICCYRRMESDRNTALIRKDSGSVSTNGISPRWVPSMMPAAVPVYSVPTEPVVYAVPVPHYYLGHHTPKSMDSEALEYLRHQFADQRQKTEDMDEEGQYTYVRDDGFVLREGREKQEVTVQGETTAEVVQTEVPPQPNGHVVNEFAASSVNYRVIRKQHKHEKMPEWLRKSYGENEQSMDLDDEGSRTSSELAAEDLVIPATPEEVVRAQVTPQNSFMESENVLQVPHGFTIVDFVDPDNRPRSSSSALNDDGEDRRVLVISDPSIPAGINATTDVNTTSDVAVTRDVTVSGNKKITTSVVTTTTTFYSSDGKTEEVSRAVDSAYVPPASTSTPRPLSPRQIEEADMGDMDSTELYHSRMRKPGEGSLNNIPEAVASAVSD